MLGVENMTTVPLEVTLNLGRSLNYVHNTSSHIIKKVIEPNMTELLMNVRRADLNGGEMILDYDFKFKEV